MPLSPKTRLGAYEILGPLGAGGMGEVYRAKDLRLGREVAVKVLPQAVASSPDRLARFEEGVLASSYPDQDLECLAFVHRCVSVGYACQVDRHVEDRRGVECSRQDVLHQRRHVGAHRSGATA